MPIPSSGRPKRRPVGRRWCGRRWTEGLARLRRSWDAGRLELLGDGGGCRNGRWRRRTHRSEGGHCWITPICRISRWCGGVALLRLLFDVRCRAADPLINSNIASRKLMLCRCPATVSRSDLTPTWEREKKGKGRGEQGVQRLVFSWPSKDIATRRLSLSKSIWNVITGRRCLKLNGWLRKCANPTEHGCRDDLAPEHIHAN
jgi:hypothetical protein